MSAVVVFFGVLGILAAGALTGWWLSAISHIQRSEWQELDDFERAQAALRHPAKGVRLDDLDGVKGGE